MPDLQPCGHPAAAVVSSDEGTQFCLGCAEYARGRREEREAAARVLETRADELPFAPWFDVTRDTLRSEARRLRARGEEDAGC